MATAYQPFCGVSMSGSRSFYLESNFSNVCNNTPFAGIGTNAFSGTIRSNIHDSVTFYVNGTKKS